MKAHFRLLSLALLVLAGCPLAAQAQCLPLRALTQDLATSHLTPKNLAATLPAGEWEMHQPATGPVYWTFAGLDPNPAPAPLPGPETRLELRRSNQQAQYDVVFKTARKACFAELRADLRHAKLKAEPVTCPQCEAERFTAANYSVTVYSQPANFAAGKAPFPYVVVVHPLAPPAAAN